MTAKRLTHLALYTTMALALAAVESLFPLPVPIPGVKLGLSNVIILAALLFRGWRDAGIILTARIVLGSLLIGRVSTLLFSAAGGILAFLAMTAALRLLSKDKIWAVSIFGALAHNTGQLFMAAFVLQTFSIFAFGPILLFSAIFTGLFTGLVTRLLLRYEPWLRL